MDRIAFVNAAGDLFTIGPDGDDLRALTSGVHKAGGPVGPVLVQSLDMTSYYTWPTWSPGGNKIAASRVQAAESSVHISLEVIDAETARSRTVYVNDVISQIARGAPHYLYWSPDDRNLAFLAPASSGLTLFVLDSFG